MADRLLESRSMDVDWQADLDRWLAPFVAALRHKTRAQMCPAYIAGLIGPGDRKSVQPMAMRAGEIGYDQLHHFVGAGVQTGDRQQAEIKILEVFSRISI